MALLNFSNITFLIGIAATVFIVVSIYGYITYKMSEQDHKISTMFSIISTMAQEQEFLRSKVVGGGGVVNSSLSSLATNNANEKSNLIQVSDGEEYEDDDELESGDDEDDDSDEDEDDEEEDDEEDDDDVESADIEVLEKEDNTSTKFLNIHLGLENDTSIEKNIEQLSDDESTLSLESSSNSVSSLMTTVKHLNSSTNTNTNTNTSKTIKTIHLEDPITIKEDILQSNNLDFLKTLHINNLDGTKGEVVVNEDTEETDYKKMPVQKLRTLVIEKGISSDPSKLKKPELLKLIEGLDVNVNINIKKEVIQL
jgi:hypothetical protein